MKFASLLLSFLFAAISISAQVNPQCPTVSIDGPAGNPEPGEPFVYSVKVIPTESRLTYKWSLSHGTIAAGQGTPSIKVRIEEDQTIPTVTVEVGGLPQDCPSQASETTSIETAPRPTKLDTFRLPLSSIGEDRFKGIADDINNNPTSQLYILVPAHNEIRDALVARLKGVDPTYITFVETNSEKKIIEIWLVPPGANPPSECQDCEKPKPAVQDCPTLIVTGPPGITEGGDLMKFTTTALAPIPSNAKFEWTVTAGDIESGQGTSSITVRTPTDVGVRDVRASVKLVGISSQCHESFFQEAGVAQRDCGLAPDDYPKLSRNEERARLYNAAYMLSKNPKETLVFVLHFSHDETAAAVKQRAAFIRNFFLKDKIVASGELHVPPERLLLVFAGTDQTHTAVYLIPPGQLASFVKGFDASPRIEDLRPAK